MEPTWWQIAIGILVWIGAVWILSRFRWKRYEGTWEKKQSWRKRKKRP